MNEDDWMSPKDVAVLVGVPLATFYGWRHAGDTPKAYKFGKHLRFRRSDVVEWIEKHQQVVDT